MIYLSKKYGEIVYEESFAKSLKQVIIVNDKDSTEIGDLYSIWNQNTNVFISSEFSDFYDYLNISKLNRKQNILIMGTKKVKEETILKYQNLLEFFYFYQEEYSILEKRMKLLNNKLKSSEDNEILKDANYKLASLNSGGKYIRGMLIAFAYKAFASKKDKKYLDLATAYETFQTSILIHDDIIDQAELRRDKKTIQELYKDDFVHLSNLNPKKVKHDYLSAALCIGDLGLYYANTIISKAYAKDYPELINYYNEIVLKTIKGEILDVLIPFKSQHLPDFESKEKEVLEVASLKTAHYSIVGPFSLGLILAKVSKNKIKEFEDALLDLGIAFQIKDDILGIFSDKAKTGKDSHNDIYEYKQTVLFTYVLNSDYKNELLKYYAKKNLSKNDIITIKKIYLKSGALEYAESLLQNLRDSSRTKIQKLKFKKEEDKRIILGFIDYLMLRDR